MEDGTGVEDGDGSNVGVAVGAMVEEAPGDISGEAAGIVAEAGTDPVFLLVAIQAESKTTKTAKMKKRCIWHLSLP
jgi:hypothetical protein